MPVDLELTVLCDAQPDAGRISAIAVTDALVFAVGTAGLVLASSNARHFETRTAPAPLDLRAVLAHGDTLVVCGDEGLLAMSRDRAATWAIFDTETTEHLHGLAVSDDGSLWIAGDNGFAARVAGGALERIDLETETDLETVRAVGDELVWLGADGNIYRRRDGDVLRIATGASAALRGLATTRSGSWIVVGSDGFIARSPDGAWFTRIKSGVAVELEGVAAMVDGTLVAIGDQFLVISRDDGRSWKPIGVGVDVCLRACERFEQGALVGGDGGVISRLASPDDDAWADRLDVFGSVRRPLDAAFADGPDELIEGGLASHLAAFGVAGSGATISPAAFEATYGVPIPAEAARLFQLLGDSQADAFEQLHVVTAPLGDAGQANLFEQLVEHDQGAREGTRLVEAFCGVFQIGTHRDGDRFHMELYEWDGRRQVLHYDHGERAFSGVFADSLDSLVYYTAIEKAHAAGLVSDETYRIGLGKLQGRIAPTREFGLLERDPQFTLLDARRRDTEFLFYRAHWIFALLSNDADDPEELRRAFNADFNQVVPAHQLSARFEACEKLNPTALYAMWRAYFFDEPELVRYLELARRHRARLVRDAAALIDALRAGRNQLGTIADMQAHVERFRQLDLDPRRAEARKVEAEAKARLEASRRAEVEAELDRTPPAAWPELAWRWLDDGIAHSVLLARLAARTDAVGQIEALDELHVVRDADRALMIPRLARELCGELEAVLVGSLVRGDSLDGAIWLPDRRHDDGSGEPARRIVRVDEPDDDDDEPDAEIDDERAAAHVAIDRVVEALYHSAEPHRLFKPLVPFRFGGDEPLDAVAVYIRDEPVSHFHFVTYGFYAAYGFELTFRLARAADDEDVPEWAVTLLQTLAGYVFSTGNRFDVGHKMGLGEAIDPESDTEIRAVLFAPDPELALLQVVGITADEYTLIQEWSTAGLVDILAQKQPLLVTDVTRASVLDDPSTKAAVRARVEAEGSSEDLTFAEDLHIALRSDGTVHIELGDRFVSALPRAMRGRLRLGRSYSLRGDGHVLHLAPGELNEHALAGGELTLTLSPETRIEIEMRLGAARGGTYRLETWPAIEILVRAEAVSAPPVTYGRADLDDEDDGDDEQDDDEHDDEHDHGRASDPKQLIAALAMSERALDLSPDDEEIQFTHAMMLVEALRTGASGRAGELVDLLPRVSVGNRLAIVAQLGRDDSELFSRAALAAFGALTELPPVSGAYVAALDELLAELGETIIARAPERLGLLVPLLPPHVPLLAKLAWDAIEAGAREATRALYERLLELPIPEDGTERTDYLRAMNNACVQAHAASAYELAVRIADRAQPVARENPTLFHAAACAYAAAGDRAKAIEMVQRAIEAGYEHLDKLETDRDLGDVRTAPEVLALFRSWRAGQGRRG